MTPKQKRGSHNRKTSSDWLETHGDALYAYALSRVRENHAAEDLLQETLLSAIQSANQFKGRSTERTWLIGIMRHKILDYFRNKARSQISNGQDLEQLPPHRQFTSKGRWQTPPRPWAQNPALLYENKEFWQVYERCRSALPDVLAQTYTLRELEGISVEDACKILDITPTNLSVRLYRARLALRECLDFRWFNA